MSEKPLKYSAITARCKNRDLKGHDASFYKAFVPANDITTLATKDAVIKSLTDSKKKSSKEDAIPIELEKTAKDVVAVAPKVFLTLIYARSSSFVRVLTHPLNDEMLLGSEIQKSPHNRTKVYGRVGGEPIEVIPPKLRNSDGKSIMKLAEHEDFFDKHWIFQAPVFKTDDPRLMYDFHWKQPLPYLVPKGPSRLIDSGFSTVRKALIHPDHYISEDSSNCPSSPEGRIVAVKTLRTISEVDTKKFYEIEAETLHKMGALKDPHLIQSVAIYKRDTERCFVFPWAEGGNLDEFWIKHDDNHDDGRLVRWATDQMLGLFEGLDRLHEENIRHGDVKPTNILHFPNSSSQLGLLVLADVGLAKFHTDYTKDRQKITSTKHSTEDYEPPEQLGKQISRYFDNWSIGCVFIEFLIWIKCGHGKLCDFRKALEEHGTERKPFWQRKIGNDMDAFVHPAVDRWVEKLRPSKYPVLYDLADLVRQKMLVPDPNQRRIFNKGLLSNFRETCDKWKFNPGNPSKASHVAKDHADLGPKPDAESSTQSFTRNASNL